MMPSSHWLQLSYVCGSYDKVFLLGSKSLNPLLWETWVFGWYLILGFRY